MRVAVFAPGLPYPPDDGQRLRTWHLTARLARTEEVTVFTWVGSDTPPETVEAVRAAVAELVVFPRTDARGGLGPRVGRHVRFAAGGLPPYVQEMLCERDLADRSGRRAFAQAVATCHRRAPFDVVVCEEEALACFPIPDLGVPVVVHRLNVFGRVLRDQLAQDPLGRARWLVEGSAWRRFDRLATAPASLAVATTPESAAELAARLGDHPPVVVVPNGVEVRQPATPPSAGRDLAFLGWMGYPPNVDAVRWFAREIWPELARRHPDARLRIVGRHPTPEVRALAGERIVVTGQVADVAAACEGVRAGVVPLRSGMGIKNKTLELLAMGRPVVTTPVGAEGIDATPDDGLWTATDAAGLLQYACRLLGEEDTAHIDALGQAARRYVERRFSWPAVADGYRSELDRLVRGRVPA